MGVQAIVLAAGFGGRMGGRKARLLLSDAPLVVRHVSRMREAGASRVIAVLRPEDERLVDAGTRVALSIEPDPAGSLARGLEHLDPGDELILVTPVDAIPAQVETITAVARAVTQGAAAAVPVFGGKGGHPVAVRALVLRAGRGRPLRDVLAELGDHRVRVPVDDRAVITDLDEPSDLGDLGPPRFA